MFDKKQIFFDLDDTLIDDNYKFQLTFCDCIRAIILSFETRSPQIDDILQLARKLDNEYFENVEPGAEKYGPEKYSKTWIACYRQLCKENGREPKDHTEKLLEGYVYQNFEPPYYIIPDVIDVLNELLKVGKYELRIVTAGAHDAQMKKIEGTDFEKYFSSFHICDGNKQDILEEAVGKYGKENVWMIGNSMRSDINPALKTGISAVYIPRGTWNKFFEEPFNKEYKEIKTIAELPALLEKFA